MCVSLHGTHAFADVFYIEDSGTRNNCDAEDVDSGHGIDAKLALPATNIPVVRRGMDP